AERASSGIAAAKVASDSASAEGPVPAPGPRSRVKKRYRLTGRREFQRLLPGRRLYAGASLVGFASPGRTPVTRVGVGASRQIRGAVARNRARRRLREAARRRLLGAGGSIEPGPGIRF